MRLSTRPRDEVEEVANSAVKEEQIEVKLAAIESDWAAFNLVRCWNFCRHVAMAALNTMRLNAGPATRAAITSDKFLD